MSLTENERAGKTHFHTKVFARRLVLTRRQTEAIRKRSICVLNFLNMCARYKWKSGEVQGWQAVAVSVNKSILLRLTKIIFGRVLLGSCSGELYTWYNTLYCSNLKNFNLVGGVANNRRQDTQRHFKSRAQIILINALIFFIGAMPSGRLLLCLRHSRSSGTEFKLEEFRLESVGVHFLATNGIALFTVCITI